MRDTDVNQALKEYRTAVRLHSGQDFVDQWSDLEAITAALRYASIKLSPTIPAEAAT